MSLLSRLLPRSPKTPQPARRPQPRLGVQQLEDRTTPTVSFDSAFEFGGTPGTHRGTDIATDVAGNTYLTGYFAGAVDFDPSHDSLGGADVRTALGAQDIFVAKYAPDNALVWVTRMGGAVGSIGGMDGGLDLGYSVSLDAAGNVLVAGKFSGTADFGPVALTSAGNHDAFAAKLSPAGNVVWAKSWGTVQADSATGIDADAAGNVYVSGYRIAAPDNSVKFTDVVKFAANSTQSWMKSFQTQDSRDSDLAVDAAGNVYVTGAFNGTVDFDPSNKVKSVSDGTGQAGTFVLKLTTAGKLGWVSAFQANTASIGGSAYAYPSAIALDANNNVIIVGNFKGVVDFNPGSGTYRLPDDGGSQGYVTKLNSSGGFAWANALATTVVSGTSGVAVDAAGSVYATGYFQGTVDLDPRANVADIRSATEGGNGGTFVVKYTAAGGYAWGGAFVGTGYVSGGSGIAVDPAGTISVLGYFQGTTDFDPDPLGTHELTVPAGQTHVYAAKLRQN